VISAALWAYEAREGLYVTSLYSLFTTEKTGRRRDNVKPNAKSKKVFIFKQTGYLR